MTLEEISRVLDAHPVGRARSAGKNIRMACGCDLMSDVLAFIKADALLLTGLTNLQVVRTAEIADVAAICFVRGKEPAAETIALADAKGIPLLVTELPLYESCGRLYREGLPGCHERA